MLYHHLPYYSPFRLVHVAVAMGYSSASEVGCRITVVTTEDSVAGAQRVAEVCRALAEAEACGVADAGV